MSLFSCSRVSCPARFRSNRAVLAACHPQRVGVTRTRGNAFNTRDYAFNQPCHNIATAGPSRVLGKVKIYKLNAWAAPASVVIDLAATSAATLPESAGCSGAIVKQRYRMPAKPILGEIAENALRQIVALGRYPQWDHRLLPMRALQAIPPAFLGRDPSGPGDLRRAARAVEGV
jgi:hypothetical protein